MFWAAFDLPMTVVPLKVALGLEKIDFCVFEENKYSKYPIDINLGDYFLDG